MTTVTSQEIALFRSQLTDNTTATEVLVFFVVCEGVLDVAALSLAFRAGQEPERANSEWLDALAKKWRAVICEAEFREDLLNGSVQKMIEYLYTMPTFPKILAVPVLLYVLKQGVNNFCEPLDALK